MKFFMRAKNEVTSFACDCISEYVCNHKQYKRLMTVGIIVMMATVIAAMSIIGFADGDGGVSELANSIKDILMKIYNGTTTVVTVLAGLGLAIALIMRMTANQQKAAQATQWAVRIAICYAAYFCIGAILKVIDSVTDGYGLDDYFGTTSTPPDSSATGS